MHEVMEPILPVVPVEGIAVHIGKSGLSMGDRCEARLLPDGLVGIFAKVRRPFLGLIPWWRVGYLGHLGPMAAQVITPALLEGASLRLRVVQLTPEHLAGTGMPEILISVWGDPRWLTPFMDVPPAFLPATEDSAPPQKAPPRRMRPA
jgi:hypothetical protein